MLDVLLSAPMWDAPRDFRLEVEAALPGVRISSEGEIPDEAVAVIIADDHADIAGRRFPNLQAALSLSVGVEHLLRCESIATAPVIRLLTCDHQRLMREYVVYQVLRAHGQFQAAEHHQRDRTWDWLPPRAPIAGRKALVLGAGYLSVPTAIALRDLGLTVTTWCRTPRRQPGITSISGEDALLQSLVDTDYVVCMLPLTEQTLQLLNAKRLRHLPSRAVLINVSRAACVDLAEVADMLGEGALTAAVWDVFDNEPLSPDSSLWTLPNLTITPHMAAVPLASAYLPAIVEALRRILDGEAFADAVDRARGY
jgi:glyoxylate/hydroxypyruvate reductase A